MQMAESFAELHKRLACIEGRLPGIGTKRQCTGREHDMEAAGRRNRHDHEIEVAGCATLYAGSNLTSAMCVKDDGDTETPCGATCMRDADTAMASIGPSHLPSSVTGVPPVLSSRPLPVAKAAEPVLPEQQAVERTVLSPKSPQIRPQPGWATCHSPKSLDIPHATQTAAAVAARLAQPAPAPATPACSVLGATLPARAAPVVEESGGTGMTPHTLQVVYSSSTAPAAAHHAFLGPPGQPSGAGSAEGGRVLHCTSTADGRLVVLQARCPPWSGLPSLPQSPC